MCQSLSVLQSPQLPAAGADVLTTDGGDAHSCRDAARWGRGEGVQT